MKNQLLRNAQIEPTVPNDPYNLQWDNNIDADDDFARMSEMVDFVSNHFFVWIGSYLMASTNYSPKSVDSVSAVLEKIPSHLRGTYNYEPNPYFKNEYAEFDQHFRYRDSSYTLENFPDDSEMEDDEYNYMHYGYYYYDDEIAVDSTLLYSVDRPEIAVGKERSKFAKESPSGWFPAVQKAINHRLHEGSLTLTSQFNTTHISLDSAAIFLLAMLCLVVLALLGMVLYCMVRMIWNAIDAFPKSENDRGTVANNSLRSPLLVHVQNCPPK